MPAASDLLEREGELALFGAHLRAAGKGAGGLVAIEGRAGMGKTRLVAEARASAQSAGFEVLAARGGELEEAVAYGVVRQLFEPLVATAGDDLRAEMLSGAAGLAAPLFDESRLAGALEDATDTSFATLHGLYWLAATLATCTGSTRPRCGGSSTSRDASRVCLCSWSARCGRRSRVSTPSS